tara:strand:+ start:516 stop:1760 length:1245 start_codon:yes stop_codon:yes gene_type:complete
MDLSVQICNEEDIEYIGNLSKEKFDKVIQTALTIGLKSIQMSEVNMDCHSYFDPLKRIIDESGEQNKDKILEIDDKLDALLHIRTNSSRKGRLSEDLCIQRLIQQYPTWDISDVTYVGHEGDCRAKTPVGEILYEFKSYDTNVNREQINKFYKDLEMTGIKLGIFVSNTSGIVGKKDLEWEIINGSTLIIYISNTGFNGQGCIMATELLLALVDNNILDHENHWLLHQNYETDSIYQNLVDSLDEYRSNNEMIYKLRKHIKEFRSKNNSMIDGLESEIFHISLNTENTFSKILGLVESIKSKKQINKSFDLDEFILNNNYSDKFIQIFKELYKVLLNLSLTIHICDNEWLIYKDGMEELAHTKTQKSKIQLCISKYPEELENFCPQYEEFKDKKIIIALNDNYKIWSQVSLRLN